MVIAADPHLQAEGSNFATALLQQIHARRSDLEQEQAQLSAEHGPSFPRVVEIGRQLQDLDRQKRRRTQSSSSASAATGRPLSIASNSFAKAWRRSPAKA
jgi:uncharacterized protein involved in exopolysaccharide biosynthesis